MSEQPATIDQLVAIGAEALDQRDRLLFTLGTVLGYFPSPDDLADGQPDTPSRLVPVRRLREWWTVIHTLKSIDRRPLIAAYMASTPDQPSRVPADLPCPKCGSGDVAMRFCAEWPCNGRSTVDPEHFHRRCGRCGYVWTTDDVLGVSR